jgi:hypothetical protein
MVSEYGTGVVLPHWSRNHTFTVFVPLPQERVQDLVDAKAAQELQEVLLLTHIWTVPPPASDALRVKAAEVFLVASAPPLIITEPVGGSVSLPWIMVNVWPAMVSVPVLCPPGLSETV